MRAQTAVIVVLGMACTACVERADRQPSRGYVLISIDTLSAEHLGLHGYDRDTSPFLDSLADRAIVFDNAIVQLPGTLPSHMSIFTGLYPEEHGMRGRQAVLAEDIATLPEIFRAGGFTTAGFTEGGYVSGFHGFARGFDVFSDERILIWGGGDHVFAKGLGFVERLAPDERFFLFLHTYAVHSPYTPPPACRSLFWRGAPPPEAGLSRSELLMAHNRGVVAISEAVADYYRALYDAEIRCLDRVIEGFFAGLEGLVALDQVTVVITSDHGEEFLDHGSMGHEQIYHENVHVPLIVVSPSQPGGQRVRAVVQSIDIAPTLYELAGLDSPEALSGRSLVPLFNRPDSDEARFAYSRSDLHDRCLYYQASGEMYQLVSLQSGADPEQKTIGVSRRLPLTVSSGPMSFQARAFLEPCRMTATIDGEVVAEVSLDPEHWQTVELEVPDTRQPHRLRLSSETCTIIPESLQLERRLCRSFVLRGLPAQRTELYHLNSDPRETRDLAFAEPDLLRRLLDKLRGQRFELVSPPGKAPVDQEVQKQLRTLGYLESDGR